MSRLSRTTRATVSHHHGCPSLTRNDCKYSTRSPPRACSFVSCRIGDSAKNAFHSNPENTVFDAKRLIGRKAGDPETKRDQKHWYVYAAPKPIPPALIVRTSTGPSRSPRKVESPRSPCRTRAKCVISYVRSMTLPHLNLTECSVAEP